MNKQSFIAVDVLQLNIHTGQVLNNYLVVYSKDLPKSDSFYTYMYGVNGNGVTYNSALQLLRDHNEGSESGVSEGQDITRSAQSPESDEN